jgi:hypothetical protein
MSHRLSRPKAGYEAQRKGNRKGVKPCFSGGLLGCAAGVFQITILV